MKAHERLKQWREREGLTEEAASLKLGVSEHVYRKWESGDREPQTSTAFNVELWTGIPWNAWLTLESRAATLKRVWSGKKRRRVTK